MNWEKMGNAMPVKRINFSINLSIKCGVIYLSPNSFNI